MAASVLIGSARPSDHGPLEAALRKKGIRASVFTEGNRMVEAARSTPPDLAIVDLHLSGLHGIEVAQTIGPQRTSILVDETEPGIADLKQLGLEVMVRPKGGAEGLASGIETRLRAAKRLAEDVAVHPEPAGERDRLLAIVGGDEERLLRVVLEDENTHLLAGGYVRKRRLEEEWLRAKTSGLGLCAAVIAIDGVQGKIEAEHGPGAMREAEQRVAGILLTELDGNDLPAKDGAGRFLVLMPATTVANAASRLFGVADEVGSMSLQGGGSESFGVTVSIGLATMPHDSVRSADDLLARAEESARAASARGGGRVCLWQGVRELRSEDFPA